MKFLFFFVHPSKFHLYRNTVNALIAEGHQVDILITKKDILEDLVKNEGWKYTNIFPEGRKIPSLPTKVGAVINTFRSLYRLNKIASKTKYDLYITDDLLTILGRVKGVPSFLFQDDDITAVPESFILLASANCIIAPACTNFGKYNHKKIGIKGFKASAYLHPNSFTPDVNIIRKHGLEYKRYFIIRLVSLTATHDVGKRGLSDEETKKIIKKLSEKGEVVISSERPLSQELEKYRKKIKPSEFIHLIAFADMFISDSQTMSMEAGFLGTPYIRFNDFVGKIGYLDELENKYKLGFGILTENKDQLFNKIEELINTPDLKKQWIDRRDQMIKQTVDLTKLMLWLYTTYPESAKKLLADPEYQLKLN